MGRDSWRIRLVVSCLAILGWAVLSQAVHAQGGPPQRGPRPGWNPGMMNGPQAALSGQLQSLQQMLSNMEVDPSDPTAVLAMKDQLGLTKKQIHTLEKIIKNARKQTSTLLTPEQMQQMQVLGTAAAAVKNMAPMMQNNGPPGHQGNGPPGNGPPGNGPPGNGPPGNQGNGPPGNQGNGPPGNGPPGNQGNGPPGNGPPGNPGNGPPGNGPPGNQGNAPPGQ